MASLTREEFRRDEDIHKTLRSRYAKATITIHDCVVEKLDHKLFEDTPRRGTKRRGSSRRR